MESLVKVWSLEVAGRMAGCLSVGTMERKGDIETGLMENLTSSWQVIFLKFYRFCNLELKLFEVPIGNGVTKMEIAMGFALES